MDYRQRLAQAAALAGAVAGVLAPRYWLGSLVLLIGGLLLANFRTRHVLLQETWRFPAYLSHGTRVAIAFVGFWVLLALAPMIVGAAGAARWLAAAILTALLLAWNARFQEVFLRLVRAEPLARPDLGPHFAAVLARARVEPPQLYRARSPGGRWANALTLPSLRGSAVLFGNNGSGGAPRGLRRAGRCSPRSLDARRGPVHCARRPRAAASGVRSRGASACSTGAPGARPSRCTRFASSAPSRGTGF